MSNATSLGKWPMEMYNNLLRHRWQQGNDLWRRRWRCRVHGVTHLADFVVKDDGSPFLSHVQKPPESVAKKDFVFPKKTGGGEKGEGGCTQCLPTFSRSYSAAGCGIWVQEPLKPSFATAVQGCSDAHNGDAKGESICGGARLEV